MMTDYIDYNPLCDIDGLPHIKTDDEIRAEELSKLSHLRTAVRFGYKNANRPAYLRQLKRCMKYGHKFVLEAKRIRKWDGVKPPKFD